MKYAIKKYTILTGILFFLSAGLVACGDDEPTDKPEPTPDPVEKPLQGTIELRQDAIIMNINSSKHLKRILKDTDADFSKLTFEMSKDDIVEVKNGRLKAINTGELVLSISYGEVTKNLSILIANCAQPLYLSPELFKKYIWDYDKSPNKIINKTGRPVIVDFWATWCQPCLALNPIIENQAETYAGGVLFLKVKGGQDDAPSRIKSEVYDAFLYSKVANLASEMINEDGDSELPTIIMVSKDKQAPKAIRGQKVVGPITNFLDKEFPKEG